MNDSMHCSDIQDMFSAYSESELDATQAARLGEHLASCPECAREWHYFSESRRLLQNVPVEPVPADFLPGIHQKLATRPSPVLAWLQGLLDHPLLSLSSLAAVGLLLITLSPLHTTLFHAEQPTPQVRSNENRLAMRPTASPFTISNSPIQALPVMNLADRSTSFRLDRAVPLTQPLPTAPLPHYVNGPLSMRSDLAITVHASSQESQALLYDRLLTQNRWRVSPAPQQGMLLIYLDASELPSLRHALSPHKVTLENPEGLAAHASTPGMLAVALHLQAD